MSVDVDVLVHEHRKAHTVDGAVVFHTAPSLLSQLRDAIHTGSVGDGAGSGGKSKLPFQAAALDLYTRIETEVWAVHRAVFNRVLGAHHVEAVLAEWAAAVNPDTLIDTGRRTYARDLVDGWVTAIEDYLVPPRLAPIDLPCPACGERFVHRVVDGELVRSAALGFRRDRRTGDTLDARCGACGVVWLPVDFMMFLTALNATPNQPKGSA